MKTADEAITIDYNEATTVLQRCKAAHGVAEAQGFALGLYAAGVDEPLKAWQRELYSEFDPADVLATECRQLLDRIFASVFVAKGDRPMEMALLLPQDILVDAARLTAVRDWCQGFLFGFGLGGEAVTGRLSAQSQELLRDIAEITRLDTADVDNSSENQSALIEIEEYLRVGVMLIRDDVSNSREQHESE